MDDKVRAETELCRRQAAGDGAKPLGARLVPRRPYTQDLQSPLS